MGNSKFFGVLLFSLLFLNSAFSQGLKKEIVPKTIIKPVEKINKQLQKQKPIEKINTQVQEQKLELQKEKKEILVIPEEPKEIRLAVGESKIIPVREVIRTAVGNPAIADIIIISNREILINGKTAGTTNITIWHKEGRTTYKVLVPKEPLSTTVAVFPLKNLRLQIIEYNYKDGEIITKTNTEMITDLEKMLSLFIEKDKFTINANLNNIVVQGTEKDLAKVRNFLEEIDKPLSQVMIEAKVIEVSEQDLKNIGARWNLQNNKVSGTFNQQGALSPNATITFNSIGGYTEQYIASLELLESTGKSKILANPKMISQDGKTATIVIGERVPIITTTMQQGTVTTSAEYIPVGIILGINPKINQDGYITTFVRSEVSTYYLTSNIPYPFITSKQAQSEIRVRDGEGIVIGGLLSSSEFESISKVPVLGDIPLFGGLFRKKDKKFEKKEIVIILIPHILSN